MQKSGLYISGAYVEFEYAGRYYERKSWREKWVRRAVKGTAMVLAAVMAVVAVNYGAGDALGYLSTVINQQSELGQVSAGAIVLQQETERLVAVEELLSAVPEEPEVIPGFPPGATLKEAKDLVVVLDPGHGGMDDGCVQDGISEKQVNLEIAYAVRKQLLEMGYQVRMTRTGDMALSLEERVKLAREAKADICVSIHQNSSDVAKVAGLEVWYSSQNAEEESARLSQLIQSYAVEHTGATQRELLEDETLVVTRECRMASCLVETGFLSNRTERQQLTSPAYQEQLAKGIASGIDLYFHPKTMYLTFDDGPSKESTEKVLDILKARNMQATFFLIGENVEKYPEIARRIAAEGHTIGIHCYRHDYKQLYSDVNSYLADFEKAHQVIEEVTGVDAKLFRFPGGSVNGYNKGVSEKIAQAMTERGYIYYDWNASLEDAVKNPEPDKLIENAVSSTLGRKSVVMLGHDVIPQTAECLDELLEQFPEYRMAPLQVEGTPVQF